MSVECKRLKPPFSKCIVRFILRCVYIVHFSFQKCYKLSLCVKTFFKKYFSRLKDLMIFCTIFFGFLYDLSNFEYQVKKCISSIFLCAKSNIQGSIKWQKKFAELVADSVTKKIVQKLFLHMKSASSCSIFWEEKHLRSSTRSSEQNERCFFEKQRLQAVRWA